jgi:D-alanine-D-alanine ligase-like ATP-grasp enzyme
MLQHEKLVTTAKKRGISITDVSELMQREAAILEYNGQSELIIEGVPMSWINISSQFYCDNKQLTKLAYKKLNIPHPKSIVFLTPDEPQIQSFLQKDQVYICKPLDSTNGISVELNVRNFQMIKSYYKKYQSLNTRFLLEEQIDGKDLRIHVIEGKIVAACIREPAFVIGNGKDTLADLMENRRAIMKTQNEYNKLEVDEATEDLLRQQKITLADIPKDGQKIQLKYVSNIAQGGIPIDITDEIHPEYQRWATALAEDLGTGYMGLDFITTNYKETPCGNSWILEINACADWMHHTFSEVRTHDMAEIILEKLFK